MPSSSTRAVYHGSENDTLPHATNDESNRSYGINRFLADQEHYHPALGKVQSPAEAEAAAEARIMAELHAFEKQFGSSDKPPSN